MSHYIGNDRILYYSTKYMHTTKPNGTIAWDKIVHDFPVCSADSIKCFLSYDSCIIMQGNKEVCIYCDNICDFSYNIPDHIRCMNDAHLSDENGKYSICHGGKIIKTDIDIEKYHYINLSPYDISPFGISKSKPYTTLLQFNIQVQNCNADNIWQNHVRNHPQIILPDGELTVFHHFSNHIIQIDDKFYRITHGPILEKLCEGITDVFQVTPSTYITKHKDDTYYFNGCEIEQFYEVQIKSARN